MSPRAGAARVRGASNPTLALGDFGDDRCGVGSSVAALVARRRLEPFVIDTSRRGFGRFAKEAWKASRSGGICVFEYPTRSTVYRRSLLPRAVLLWLVFGRSRLRLHLHEYKNLRRMLKWPVTLGLPLASRVVVSGASESAAVASALRGLVSRTCEVVIAPPTNGTAPDDAQVAQLLRRTGPRTPTGAVGVFGMRRDDKQIAWLVEVLSGLPGDLRTLVFAGAGWEDQELPAAVTARFEVVRLGHVPAESLPAILDGWDLAVAPFDNPAHDGRMSLRTTLAYGVPTITVGPPGPDLSLRPSHLRFTPPDDPGAAAEGLREADRAEGAAAVARFEDQAAVRLEEALFGSAECSP